MPFRYRIPSAWFFGPLGRSDSSSDVINSARAEKMTSVRIPTLQTECRSAMAQRVEQRGFGEMPMLYAQRAQHSFRIASIQKLSVERGDSRDHPTGLPRSRLPSTDPKAFSTIFTDSPRLPQAASSAMPA